MDDVFTYVVGGKAGEGVKKAGSTAANMFASMGRSVFQMDDYPSLIRGGHNFAAVSTSTRELSSHYMSADVVVALDDQRGQRQGPALAARGTTALDQPGHDVDRLAHTLVDEILEVHRVQPLPEPFDPRNGIGPGIQRPPAVQAEPDAFRRRRQRLRGHDPGGDDRDGSPPVVGRIDEPVPAGENVAPEALTPETLGRRVELVRFPGEPHGLSRGGRPDRDR